METEMVLSYVCGVILLIGVVWAIFNRRSFKNDEVFEATSTPVKSVSSRSLFKPNTCEMDENQKITDN